jgi:general secretion pathway protein G
MTMREHVKNGFTLVEMLIVLAIMGIVMAVATPAYFTYKRGAQKRATAANLRTIKQALETYRDDVGDYPASLRDLVKKPTDEKAENWDGPYTSGKDEPKDGFGFKFHYAVTPGAENPYELYSYGRKGKGSPKEEWVDVWKL